MPSVPQPAGGLSHPCAPPCPRSQVAQLLQNQPGPGRKQLSHDSLSKDSQADPSCGLSVPTDLGSSSVRAGLQSLEASGRLEDEFDMFALTRGSSLADQRKE